jgi:hypothetical protein
MTIVSQDIVTLEQLHIQLQWALQLEHATIPPYMCALYSLDAERNPEPAHIVSSVLTEEMLHVALAANILNAVGGRPRFDSPELLPAYPHPLPHHDHSVLVNLLPFGPDALDLFMDIERPALLEDPPQLDEYQTIGQFYACLGDALRTLCATEGEAAVFCGAPERQVSDVHFRGGGSVITVEDLDSALAALAQIVEQGEGTARTDVWDGDRDACNPGRDEVAHFFRFQELSSGRYYRRGDTPFSGPTGDAIAFDPEGVFPMRPNPCTTDHPAGSAIFAAQHEFNQTYSDMLRMLDDAFNGSPATLGQAIGKMFTLRTQAQRLMQMPSGDGRTTAGPTFEYLPPRRSERRRSAKIG